MREGVGIRVGWGMFAAVLACGGGAGSTSEGSTSGSTSAGSTSEAQTSGSSGDAAGELVWSEWTRFPEHRYRGQVFEGDAARASDPCVVRDGDTIRMFYTCLTGAARGGLCEAVSSDGRSWTRVPSIVPGVEGVVLDSVPGAWNENIETCSVVAGEAGLDLYFSGYRALDGEGTRDPAALGLARASDGVAFAYVGSEPVMTATPHGRDGSDIFSAHVFAYDGGLAAVYVGYCQAGYHRETVCDQGEGIVLLGASLGAGGTWEKRSEPVLTAREDVAAMQYGVAEPAVIRGPDDRYYLFFTGGLGDSEPRVTLLARSDGPFGPWELRPEPLWAPEAGSFEACGAFAPDVLITDDRVQMWYLAIDDCAGACASCNFAECGCEPVYSIGYAESPWPLSSQ